MGWTASAALAIATSLLVLQGCSFLIHLERSYHTRCAGWLTIFLAVACVLACFLFASGALVLSPEFAIVMAQGLTAQVALFLFVLGVALAAGLVLYVTRCRNGIASHGKWLTLAGTAVGVISFFSTQDLNPYDPVALRIRYYDLWSPFLMLWVAICGSECLMIALAIKDRWTRGCVALMVPIGLALAAIHRAHLGFQYAGPHVVLWWRNWLVGALPVLLGVGTWRAIRGELIGKQFPRPMLRVVLPLFMASLGLISSKRWVKGWPLRDYLAPEAIYQWLVLVMLVLGYQAYRNSTRKASTEPLPKKHSRLAHGIVVLCLASLLFGLMDTFRFAWLDPTWDLVGSILAIVVLLELLGDRPLLGWLNYEWIKHIVEAELPIRELAKVPLNLFRIIVAHTTEWLKVFFKADSKVGAVFRIVLFVAFLLAVSEIPNAGRTIIQPFTTVGLPEGEKDLGRLVSDRIVNTLGLLRQEFRTDLLVILTESSKSKGISVASAGEQADSLQAAVKNSDLEIPGTKFVIPIGFLATPIQAPVRELLGVRVIRGSVQKEEQQYLLLANSTTGETWRDPNPTEIERSALQQTPGENLGQEKPSSPEKGSAITREMAELADDLAYRIVSTDPALAKEGMTSSWRAVEPFRRGLAAWNRFDMGKDYGALTESILEFKKAIKEDPMFVLAHYRLGRALAMDGQPGAATTAFQDSLKANPQFAAGQIALADVLYYYDVYCCYQSPAALSRQESSEQERNARIKLARELWQRAIRLTNEEISPADKAAAFSGLARVALDAPAPERTSSYVPLLTSNYLSYFFGRRAERLYGGLSPILRADPQIQAAEASVLNELGVALETSARTSYKGPGISVQQDEDDAQKKRDWHCAPESVSKDDLKEEDGTIFQHTLSRGPYNHAALRYFQKAVALQPEDPGMNCDLAASGLADANPVPMRDLEGNDQSHLYLGRGYVFRAEQHFHDSEYFSDNAKRLYDQDKSDAGSRVFLLSLESEEYSAEYYRLALAEFTRAVRLAPFNLEALNEYAYTFWVWRLHSHDFTDMNIHPPVPFRPEASIAHNAERYARQAARLAAEHSTPADEAMMRSTLGEVLLGQARPDEAIEVLEEVVSPKGKLVNDHAVFNEIRWDLAEAYICAGKHARAVEYLDQIRRIEANREVQPFTNSPHSLDSARFQNVCHADPGTAVESQPDPKGQFFQLKGGQPSYASHVPCGWSGIVGYAEAENGQRVGSLNLHVWGGGVDTRIPIGETAADDVFLTSAPRDSRFYYFAQLEDVSQSPISAVYPVTTFANNANGECPKNQISLTFSRVRSKPSPEKVPPPQPTLAHLP